MTKTRSFANASKPEIHESGGGRGGGGGDLKAAYFKNNIFRVGGVLAGF